MAKVSVIGSGNVGATVAHLLLLKKLANVVLLDLDEGLAKGKALDLQQSLAVEGIPLKVTGTADYGLTKDSDLVVVTAGLLRKPGMSRDDLLAKNSAIVKSVVQRAADNSPNCILVIVTNPLDAMTWLAKKASGFEKGRVIGMAGVLDAARFSTFLAEKAGVSVSNISTMVLGAHGDSMVPLHGSSRIAGHPLQEFLDKDSIGAIVDRTRKGGAEIVSLLKTGSAYYAPASSVAAMAEAILLGSRKIFSCSVFLEGEYGFSDVCIGVPAILGKSGVEKILELPLSGEEKEAFAQSVKKAKQAIEKLSGK